MAWETGPAIARMVEQSPYDPANSTPRETKTFIHTKTCTLISTAALFIIARVATTQIRTNRLINKMFHAMEHILSAITRNDVLART